MFDGLPDFEGEKGLWQGKPVTFGKLIGSGATADVYKVTPADGEAYALKIASVHDVKAFKELNQRHVHLSGAEHTVMARAVGDVEFPQAQNVKFAAIELRLASHDLKDELESSGTLSVERTSEMMMSVVQALENTGLVHNDIKPMNILLDEKGSFNLADWDQAREPNAPFKGVRKTMRYASLESLYNDAEKVNEKQDVFSLAATAYHALSKEDYRSDSFFDKTIKSEDPPKKKFNRQLDIILEKAVRSNPNERSSLLDMKTDLVYFETARELVEDSFERDEIVNHLIERHGFTDTDKSMNLQLAIKLNKDWQSNQLKNFIEEAPAAMPKEWRSVQSLGQAGIKDHGEVLSSFVGKVQLPMDDALKGRITMAEQALQKSYSTGQYADAQKAKFDLARSQVPELMGSSDQAIAKEILKDFAYIQGVERSLEQGGRLVETPRTHGREVGVVSVNEKGQYERQGVWRAYNDQRETTHITSFKNDQAHGHSESFVDGRQVHAGEFDAGKPIKRHHLQTADGQVKHKTDYTPDGKLLRRDRHDDQPEQNEEMDRR